MTYTLIGAAVSLYTGKARGYLRWKNVPFREQMSTREVYKSEILPRVGWSVIPVVVHHDGSDTGVTLQDTTECLFRRPQRIATRNGRCRRCAGGRIGNGCQSAAGTAAR